MSKVTIVGRAKICKGSRADSKNSIDSNQNGPTKKLIGKGRARARAQAEARDCGFERSSMNKESHVKHKPRFGSSKW